jgi:hypothetical protein
VRSENPLELFIWILEFTNYWSDKRLTIVIVKSYDLGNVYEKSFNVANIVRFII